MPKQQPSNTLTDLKTLDQDQKALALVKVMASPVYNELTPIQRATQAELTPSEYDHYMENVEFLDWATKRLRHLYKEHLPSLLNKATQQAMEGSIKHQKLIMEFTGALEAKQSEHHNPNIVIINNIPDPDKTPAIKIIDSKQGELDD